MTDFWRRWLTVASAATEATGLLLVLAALVGPPAVLFDFLYYPGEADVVSADTLAFTLGVTGAVTAGWGATMAFAFHRSDNALALSVSRALVPGLAIWFVLDGVVSVSTGATLNLIGNTVLLSLFIPPLVASRHELIGQRA
ncbi:MAG: hypothetical protein ABFR95_01390 [Actinomycetota bacterium]